MLQLFLWPFVQLYLIFCTVPPPTFWIQPPKFALRLLANIFLWLQPTKMYLRGPVPMKKVLFVCNHVNYSLDVPGVFASIYLLTGVYPRSIADRFHFKIPFWPWLLHLLGGFEGTASSCEELMQQGAPMLVYPGGREEVFKGRNDPKYALLWKQRLGFARLATKYGYQIVPVGSVGMEEMLTVLGYVNVDPILKLFGETKNDPLVCPVCIPTSWQRQYCTIGPCISTNKFDHESKEDLTKVRDLAKKAVLDNIDIGLRYQREDPSRYILSHNVKNLFGHYYSF
ncbi:hypothetical protein EDD86DRAFT_188741 [Gorgonomyces haynaldii]|nr:hypothetical protein EDD86DRAFT_188741 [Gorgonomyces haynaldii]